MKICVLYRFIAVRVFPHIHTLYIVHTCSYLIVSVSTPKINWRIDSNCIIFCSFKLMLQRQPFLALNLITYCASRGGQKHQSWISKGERVILLRTKVRIMNDERSHGKQSQ